MLAVILAFIISPSIAKFEPEDFLLESYFQNIELTEANSGLRLSDYVLSPLVVYQNCRAEERASLRCRYLSYWNFDKELAEKVLSIYRRFGIRFRNDNRYFSGRVSGISLESVDYLENSLRQLPPQSKEIVLYQGLDVYFYIGNGNLAAVSGELKELPYLRLNLEGIQEFIGDEQDFSNQLDFDFVDFTLLHELYHVVDRKWLFHALQIHPESFYENCQSNEYIFFSDLFSEEIEQYQSPITESLYLLDYDEELRMNSSELFADLMALYTIDKDRGDREILELIEPHLLTANYASPEVREKKIEFFCQIIQAR